MDCQFKNPQNLGNEDWEFSEMICDFKISDFKIFEAIETTSPPKEFYLSKTINYGDFLIIFFLSIFLIFLIVKSLWNFIFKKE